MSPRKDINKKTNCDLLQNLPLTGTSTKRQTMYFQKNRTPKKIFRKKKTHAGPRKNWKTSILKKNRFLKKDGPTAWRFSRDILKKWNVEFFSAHSRRIDVIADLNISCHRSSLTTIVKHLCEFFRESQGWCSLLQSRFGLWISRLGNPLQFSFQFFPNQACLRGSYRLG